MNVTEIIQNEIQRLLEKNKAQFDDEAEYLSQTLRDAATIMFGEADPAYMCMDRFLKGSGEAWEFDLNELFGADKGARSRVFSETIRRALQLPTLHERENVKGFGVWAPAVLDEKIRQVIDPVITIFQRNYSTLEWWGALGTYNISWEVVGRSGAKDRLFVKLSGDGEYRWHPQDNRSTKALHQMGHRLTELGKAKNFPMIGKPRTFSVDVTKRRMEEAELESIDFQHNPTPGRPLIDPAVRLIKSYF
jgi:hypothetical protein